MQETTISKLLKILMSTKKLNRQKTLCFVSISAVFECLVAAFHTTIAELDFEIEIKGDNAIGVQLIKAVFFLQVNFRLISKPLITSGMCRTSKRGPGRHFNTIDMIPEKVD